METSPQTYIKHTRLQILSSEEDEETETCIQSLQITSDEFTKNRNQSSPPSIKLQQESSLSKLQIFSNKKQTIFPQSQPQTPDTISKNRRYITQSSQANRSQFPQGGQNSATIDRYASATKMSDHMRISVDQFQGNQDLTPHKSITTRRKDFTEEKSNYRSSEPAYQFQERAIPLVTVKANGKFELNQEVVQMMEYVKGPIGVVAVAGMYRTGKSYLLNRLLLNRNKGFNVGPTINPCTKGIWIWGTPLKSFTSTGEPCNVLIVDSEGIGGLDEDNNHDMRIFSLALLISSYFIYNSMSQIDENALQNLSLVVNLTKHIQTTAGTLNLTDSASDLDAYLPTFMWVVRDFSLQLEDEEGNAITDKDYLELALQQKGKSKTEAKNQIRAALLRHFKRRDCCTMIRPLVEEDLLQKLEDMELEELRTEFVEQVVNLRKKVLGKIPVKKINDTPIDGSTWMGLLKQYTQAFNEDRVPNVDSSWSYICRQRAEQNFIKAAEFFEQTLSEIQIPMNHDELLCFLEEQSQCSLELFEQQLLEPIVARDVQVRLQQWLKERFGELTIQNLNSCYETAEQMLIEAFQQVDQFKQMLQEPQLLQQVDLALRQLSDFYEDNCYNFPEKRIYLAEAKCRFLTELLSDHSRYYQQQSKLQSDIEQQTKERLSSQLQQQKEETRQEHQQLQQLLRTNQLQKMEQETQLNILQEQMEQLKQSKLLDDTESNKTISQLKLLLGQKSQQIEENQDLFDEQTKELHRTIKQGNSSQEKQSALYEQKISFLEEQVKDLQNRELIYLQETNEKTNKLSQELKLVSSKYEQELKELQISLDQHKELSSDLETQLQENTLQLQQSNQKYREVEQTMSQSLQQSQLQIKDLQMQSKIPQIPVDRLKQKENELNQQIRINEDLEQKLKSNSESQLKAFHDNKKDLAMRDQKIEFLQMQLDETREILELTQLQHQNMINMLHQNQETPSCNNFDQLQELENQCETANQQLIEINNTNTNLLQQVFDLQNEISQHKQEIAKLQSNSKQQIIDFDLQKSLQNDKLRVIETQLSKSQQDCQQLLSSQNAFKISELQEMHESHQIELREIQERYEQQQQQLKEFYDTEKEKFTKLMAEDKERNVKKAQQQDQNFQDKYNELQQQHDQELAQLQSTLQGFQQVFSLVAQKDSELQELQLANQKLEREVNDVQKQLNMKDQFKNTLNDQTYMQFEQSRQQLQQKLENSQQQNLEKDRQIQQVQSKLERNQDQFDRIKQETTFTEQSLIQEKAQLQEKYDLVKKRMQEVQDETMNKSNNFEREKALLEQQVEFQIKRIEELNKSNENSQKLFDEKLRQYRQEVFQDAQAQVERVTSEKELWESKYDQKRKSLKESEQQSQSKISTLQQQIQTLTNQLNQLQQDLNSKEQEFMQQSQTFKQQLAEEALQYNTGPFNQEDIIRMKGQLQECERELQDCQSNYERDRALWEGKCQFLEQQKDTYKRDLLDSQRKFEMTLEQLQKRSFQEKDKSSEQYLQTTKMLEGKYKNQIKEIITANQILQQEQNQKVKRLEHELYTAKEQLNLEQRLKSEEIQENDRKIQEYQCKINQLTIELQDEKQERIRRINEFQKQIDREKEINKQKCTDLDRKAKENETKRAQLYFQIEKDRASWLVEQDQYQNKLQELQDLIQQLERSKDLLKRENDKLRNGQDRQGVSPGIPRFTLNTSNMNILKNSFPSQQSQGQGTTNTINKAQIKKDFNLPIATQQTQKQNNRYKIAQHLTSTEDN